MDLTCWCVLYGSYSIWRGGSDFQVYRQRLLGVTIFGSIYSFSPQSPSLWHQDRVKQRIVHCCCHDLLKSGFCCISNLKMGLDPHAKLGCPSCTVWSWGKLCLALCSLAYQSCLALSFRVHAPCSVSFVQPTGVVRPF